jgi:hypothetical protein
MMKHFFILGCPRSGTTMLQQALNRHSGIVVPPETKYFSAFLGHPRKYQLRRLQRINEDLHINVSPPEHTIRAPLQARGFFNRIADAYLTRLGRHNITFFGEKTPQHSGYVPQIRRVFPDAKFLWIYRDGRDVALSMRKVEWMNRNIAVNFLVWLFHYHRQMHIAKDKALDILFIKYEDLVSQPRQELSRVTDFLRVPFEPQVAWGNGNREGILEWEYAWKSQALKPITTERIGNWQKELSDQEITLLEWLGGRALKNLGYEVTARPSLWSNLARFPSIAVGLARYLCRVPLDETTNQLLGRAICLG